MAAGGVNQEFVDVGLLQRYRVQITSGYIWVSKKQYQL